MANRCTLGNHDKCIACNSPVSSIDKAHHHVYQGATNGIELLCSDCVLATIYAATWTLTKLEAAGFTWKRPEELIAHLRNHCALGIDVELGY